MQLIFLTVFISCSRDMSGCHHESISSDLYPTFWEVWHFISPTINKILIIMDVFNFPMVNVLIPLMITGPCKMLSLTVTSKCTTETNWIEILALQRFLNICLLLFLVLLSFPSFVLKDYSSSLCIILFTSFVIRLLIFYTIIKSMMPKFGIMYS